MEDSAKRKERLQAMRMEASSSSGGPSPSFSTTNTPLSNPLIHPAGLVNENSPPSHRFDYYTDPAAAYSAVKRKTSNSGSGGGHGGHFQPSNVSSPVSAARPIGRRDLCLASGVSAKGISRFGKEVLIRGFMSEKR
ncbi:uncharacterized protein LOC110034238, partial [Phalaenopsis equestris]|uniref:uncharacterized protein LOC110034238 n=1 Tax=Phalaenopsis equestris TaxID=78828 RepID=UPI0009E4F028